MDEKFENHLQTIGNIVTPGDYINLKAKICTKFLIKIKEDCYKIKKEHTKTKEFYFKIGTSSFIFTFSNYMTSLK